MMIYRFTTRLTPRDRQRRWGVLLILGLPGIVAGLMNLGVPISLPGCPLLHWVGIPCPGWGLTRSVTAIARGDWAQAVSYNLFGFVFLGGVMAAIAHQAVELWQNRRLSTVYLPVLRQQRTQLAIVAVWFGYHGGRVAQMAQSGELHQAMTQSVWGAWLLQVMAHPLAICGSICGSIL